MSLQRAMKYSAGTIAYPGAAKASPAFLIPMSSRFLKVLWLYLSGTFVVTGGTGAGTLNPDGAVNLIQQVVVKRNGRPIKAGMGATFLRVANRYYNVAGRNAGITAKTAASYPFTAIVPIMFEAVGSISPLDTYLDERLAGQNLELDITWGDGTSLISGSDATSLTFTNTQVEVFVSDTAPFQLKAPFWTFDESETLVTPVGTSSKTLLNINWTKQQIVRGILLQATDGGVVSDAILKHVTLLINGNSDKPWDFINADFSRGVADALFKQQFADAVGYYHLELAELTAGGLSMVGSTGLGARLPKGTDINTLQLQLDTVAGAGVTQITAHVLAHIPPSGYAQASTS